MFRFTSDKLQLSDGMVKCGVCRNIFDARPRLLVESDSGYVPFNPDDQENVAGIPEEQGKFLREFSEPIHIDADSESGMEEEDSEFDSDSQWDENTITILDSVTGVYSGYAQDWTNLPLYEAISLFINSERTGTAMVVFTDLSMAKIYIDSGQPRSARYGSAEGSNAFRSWGDLKVLTVKFHADKNLVYSSKNLDSIMNL
jgi:hypothetical protein